ncbi:MAG: DNA-binding protein [Firmicutes bacterium]|nr:DNA-binding protein [Bacillota bacterium]
MPSAALMTAQEVAEALDISVETVLKFTQNKQIPSTELANGEHRYDLSAVLAALPFVKERSIDYPVKQPLTYEDYLKIPNEPGVRIEILDGVLVKDPSPVPRHQFAGFRIALILEKYFATRDPKGILFIAPLDITLTEVNVVQPDLLYVSGSQKSIIEEKRINGAPEIVVEVLSPGSLHKDRVLKMEIYLKAGVGHYWLVDPHEKTFEAYQLSGGKYVLVATGRGTDTVLHPDFPGLKVNLEELWQD